MIVGFQICARGAWMVQRGTYTEGPAQYSKSVYVANGSIYV